MSLKIQIDSWDYQELIKKITKLLEEEDASPTRIVDVVIDEINSL